MGLPNNILSEFAKAAKPTDNTKRESTVYATIVKQGDKTYAKIDGSDLLTPIIATADTVDGERVTMMIKDHTAVVTGNLSSPAARKEDVDNVIHTSGESSTKVEVMTVQISEILTALKNCEDDIDNLQSADSEINTKLLNQADDIATIKTDITNIKSDIEEIDGKLTSILSEIEAIKQSLT